MPDLHRCIGMWSSCAIIILWQPGNLMNSCGKRHHEVNHNDDYASKVRAATACLPTSVAKIRLVVVVAYTASNLIAISGYLRWRFQLFAQMEGAFLMPKLFRLFLHAFFGGFAAVSLKPCRDKHYQLEWIMIHAVATYDHPVTTVRPKQCQNLLLLCSIVQVEKIARSRDDSSLIQIQAIILWTAEQSWGS